MGVDRPTDVEAGYLILQELAPGVGMANLAWAFECAAGFDRDAFAAALCWLVQRHPTLRTVLPPDGAGGWHRRVVRPEDVLAPVSDRPVDADGLAAGIERAAYAPFDITLELPVRAVFLGPVVVLAVHHVAVDAVAADVLLAELDDGYRRFAAGAELPAGEVPWRAQDPAPEPPAASVRYWRDRLDGVDSDGAVLRGFQQTVEPRTFAARTIRAGASAGVPAALAALRTAIGVTPNVVLLAAFSAVLAAHGAGPDFAVGVPVRLDSGDAGLGSHVTVLPLRVQATGRMSFRELTGAVGAAFFEGMDHVAAPYDHIVPLLRTTRGGWRVPVLRQIFNYLPAGASGGFERRELSFGGSLQVPKNLCRYELEFRVEETPSGLDFAATYSTELFEPEAVAGLVRRYDQILVAAARYPDRALSEL